MKYSNKSFFDQSHSPHYYSIEHWGMNYLNHSVFKILIIITNTITSFTVATK